MVRLAIFDLDGTLYRGDEPIPGAVKAVQEIRNRTYRTKQLSEYSEVV